MSVETELKLRIAPEEIPKFFQHPLLKTAVYIPPPHQLHNTYFDSPECNLQQQGIGLRVRRFGQQRVQTLKTAGTTLGGLHQRQEWEMPIHQDTPDWKQFPQEVLPVWCSSKKNLHSVRPIFTTEFLRHIWEITLSEGTQVEMALDQGEIRTDVATIPLNEIELELKTGAPDKLYHLALKLQDELSLTVENHSKAARGYALFRPQPLQSYKATSLHLTPEMSAEQAFIQIIWHCLGHLQANEDIVLEGKDVEGVHQMRVALRRLRSCLNLYQSLIPKESHSTLRKELKWVANSLGIARDWDILNLSLQEMLSIQQSSALWKLQKTALQSKEQAYQTVRETVRSVRYSRLLLSLGEWVTKRAWQYALSDEAAYHLTESVKHFASKVLHKRYRQFCERGEHFEELDVEQRHLLRIQSKKLNYGVRFFAELFPTEIVKPFIKALSHLQEELGILNDAHTALHLLNESGLEENTPIYQFVNGWYAYCQFVHLSALQTHWDSFLEQPVFWK